MRLEVAATLDAGKRAAHGARASCLAIHDSTSLSQGGQHVAAKEQSFEVINPILPNFDRATKNLTTAIEFLRKKLSGPEISATAQTNLMSVEIRAALKAMPVAERLATLTAAANSGDDLTVAAALAGPELLTNLTADQKEHLRSVWANGRFPDDVKRHALLESDLGHLTRGGKLLQTFWLQCADRKRRGGEGDRRGERACALRARDVALFVAWQARWSSARERIESI